MSAVLCFMVKYCFYLALYLGVGERNSNVSSIFQALHLLGLLLASAGPCRWLHSPVTLINNCCPTWRVGLQSDSRIISLQAAAVPCWKWVCGDPFPLWQCQGPPRQHVQHGPCFFACHSKGRYKVQRLQLSFQNPGVNYGLNLN